MNPSEKLLYAAGETLEYSNQYVQKNIKLLKLEMAEKLAKIFSSLVLYFVLAFMFSLVLLLLTLGMVVFLGNLWNSYMIAFFAAAAFYSFLIILIANFLKNYLITNPVLKIILNALLDE